MFCILLVLFYFPLLLSRQRARINRWFHAQFFSLAPTVPERKINDVEKKNDAKTLGRERADVKVALQ